MIDLKQPISKLIGRAYKPHTDIAKPDWNILLNFGLPLNIENYKKKKYNYSTVFNNIILAAQFLKVNKKNSLYLRHFDSFKALLLALKTHYPTRFRELNDKSNFDLIKYFNMKNIQGRHIKLRNICLTNLSKYFNK